MRVATLGRRAPLGRLSPPAPLGRLAPLALFALAAALAFPAPAAAQMGELQLGGTASYGAPDAFREGAGVVAGCGIARLIYVGARWSYHAGSRQRIPGTGDISTRAQLLTADVGLMFPTGELEIVPGVSAGAVWFRQSGPEGTHTTRFAIAPGLSVHIHVAGLVAIPELQYLFVGNPRLAAPVSHSGPAATLRLVIPIELRRIIY